MLSIDSSERATLRAALRLYFQQGQGEPSLRSDEIHDLATDGGKAISLDDNGIKDLEHLVAAGYRKPRPVPTTLLEWAALAQHRGWNDILLAHARAAVDAKFPGETVIELPGGVALQMPCYPFPCDYVRLVDRTVGRGGIELMYWSSEEWGSEPEEVIGAVVGMIKSFQPKLSMELEQLRSPELVYERTASIDDMAKHIATIAEGEAVVDADVARSMVQERFPMDTWRYEVANEDTNLGYWEWALHQAEEEQEEVEPADVPRGG